MLATRPTSELNAGYLVSCAAMEARAIFQTVLYAPDLAPIENFYRDVFGLEVLSRSQVVAVFRCGPGVLLVFNPEVARRPGRAVPAHGPEGPGHIAFAMPMHELEGW